MVNRNKYITAGIVLVLAIICVLIATNFLNTKANELIRFAIYPSYGYGYNSPSIDSSYYFVLYDDSVLKCYMGEMNMYHDIQENRVLNKIIKSSKKKLLQDEFAGLINLADKLIASGFTSPDCDCSGWYYVTLLYDGTVFTEVYQLSKIFQPYQTEALERLYEEILRLSPLKIELEDFDVNL